MAEHEECAANTSTPATSGGNETSIQSSSVGLAQCAHCGKTPEAVKECNRCHSVAYCNKDCQKSHFKSHKKECASLAQTYMSTHTPKLASRAPPKETNRNTGFKKWQFDT